MKTFALVLACLGLIAFATACSERDKTPGNDGDRKTVEAPIDGIDILVRESFPPGYTAHILSGLPSGCARFDAAKVVGRSGTTITIRVTNTIPTDTTIACTAIYGTHESNVDLGKDFISGTTYTVQVNDRTKTFVAQ
ncbi:MAG: hypothetical protein AB7J35_11245 [Dehalococcoidia bacterium]